jgi:hypothetical protein
MQADTAGCVLRRWQVQPISSGSRCATATHIITYGPEASTLCKFSYATTIFLAFTFCERLLLGRCTEAHVPPLLEGGLGALRYSDSLRLDYHLYSKHTLVNARWSPRSGASLAHEEALRRMRRRPHSLQHRRREFCHPLMPVSLGGTC